MTITEPAPAKINLALHIRGRRPDGYHDLETLFAFARDGDVVTIREATADSFAITGPFAWALSASSGLSEGSSTAVSEAGAPRAGNLVEQARDAFRATFGCPPVAIALEKNLPVASGIGGGSADAAATLRGLARLCDVAPDDARLYAIAAKLGADVPACLLGRTSLGTGRGDSLDVLDGLSGTAMLLVNPGVEVSTAAVFARWDGVDRGGIGEGSLIVRAAEGRNDLEAPARAIAPVIGEVRAMLDRTRGALLSRMSGSGATCFALFDDSAARDEAAAAASARDWWTLRTELA